MFLSSPIFPDVVFASFPAVERLLDKSSTFLADDLDLSPVSEITLAVSLIDFSVLSP